MNANIGGMLEARPAEHGMGRGLFATVDIQVGTRILVEGPMISLPKSPTPFREFCQAARLKDSDTNGLKDLHCNARLLNENLPGNIVAQIRSEDPTIDLRDDSVLDLVKLYTTYYTNAVAIGEDGEDGEEAGSAVFRTFSYINHSCDPNVFGMFSTETNRQTLYAGRYIKRGQQILISYFGDNEDFMTREQRLEETRRDWGFKCRCKVCMESHITDPRHEKMGLLKKELDRSTENWPPDDDSAPQDLVLEVVEKSEKLLTMMEKTGVGSWKLRQT